MGNSLQDQLLKMGLVDSDQVRKVKHEKRVSNGQKGRGARESDHRRRESKADKDRQAVRQADRTRAKSSQTEAEAREIQLRIKQIVESGRVAGKVHGRRRFYFETRDGRVPYLELADEVMTRLEHGRIALAESPAGKTTLVEGSAAARIFELDDQWLRVWNG